MQSTALDRAVPVPELNRTIEINWTERGRHFHPWMRQITMTSAFNHDHSLWSMPCASERKLLALRRELTFHGMDQSPYLPPRPRGIHRWYGRAQPSHRDVTEVSEVSKAAAALIRIQLGRDIDCTEGNGADVDQPFTRCFHLATQCQPRKPKCGDNVLLRPEVAIEK